MNHRSLSKIEKQRRRNKLKKQKNREKNFENDPMFFSKINIPKYGLGYIVGYSKGFYAVDFDKFIIHGTDCNGLCRNWHGIWVPEDQVEFAIAIVSIED